jgi:hypothetical protein
LGESAGDVNEKFLGNYQSELDADYADEIFLSCENDICTSEKSVVSEKMVKKL